MDPECAGSLNTVKAKYLRMLTLVVFLFFPLFIYFIQHHLEIVTRKWGMCICLQVQYMYMEMYMHICVHMYRLILKVWLGIVMFLKILWNSLIFQTMICCFQGNKTNYVEIITVTYSGKRCLWTILPVLWDNVMAWSLCTSDVGAWANTGIHYMMATIDHITTVMTVDIKTTFLAYWRQYKKW